jgi:hypothetical protein
MIAGNLEYIMSSLPHLTFEDREEERFRVLSIFKKYALPGAEDDKPVVILDDLAMNYLSPSSFQKFRQIDLRSIHSEFFQKSKNSVLAAFSSYVLWLKSEIRQLRLSRKKSMEAPSVKNALLPLNPGDPLEEEVQLLKWQWNKLEDLSIGHYSDFEALCAYKLKLLILLQWWSFDQEKGFGYFLKITKND